VLGKVCESGLVARRLLVVADGRDSMLKDSVGGGWLADGKVSRAVGGDRRDDSADAGKADRCEALAVFATGGDDTREDWRDGLADARFEEARDNLVD
jgi:hypothetical protein